MAGGEGAVAPVNTGWGGKGGSEEGRAAGTGDGDSPHSHRGEGTWPQQLEGVRGQSPGLAVPLQEGRVSVYRARHAQDAAAKPDPSKTSRTGQQGQHRHLFMHEDP